ncbi:MAG: ABC transporter ATP-binding protein [Aestuariivirga sp.]
MSKHYGNAAALTDLSLDVRRGEFLTLLGPSGCGKTTTLRLIGGFEVPDQGSVVIGGRDVTNVPPFHRNVNTVFQNYALFPHLTVFENVAYALRVKRLSGTQLRDKVSAMLDRMGLAEKARKYPRELSGGQMQRVALGRALINEPSVLLLDEPLSALDAKLRRAMQLELRRMHSELGLTFVCVTHDQEEALVMSDRIAVLDAGRLAQIGTPQDIFERPSNQFVADFIGGCNFVDAFSCANGDFLLPGCARAQQSEQQEVRRVLLAIRPQSLRLGAAEAGAVFDVAARVSDIVYLGTAVRLVLSLSDGAVLTAETSKDGVDKAGAIPGAMLRVWALKEDVMVFDTARSGHGPH